MKFCKRFFVLYEKAYLDKPLVTFFRGFLKCWNVGRAKLCILLHKPTTKSANEKLSSVLACSPFLKIQAEKTNCILKSFIIIIFFYGLGGWN